MILPTYCCSFQTGSLLSEAFSSIENASLFVSSVISLRTRRSSTQSQIFVPLTELLLEASFWLSTAVVHQKMRSFLDASKVLFVLLICSVLH